MNDLKLAVKEIEDGYDVLYCPAEFLEQYEQLECLSAGHGTDTYLVKKKGGEEIFVAKCYDKRVHTNVHENSILKELNHRGLPAFVDEFQNDFSACVVREYVEGTPLDQYLEQRELSYLDVIDIGTQLCDILVYLHERDNPVIHRDIKPQNVILKADGQVALIDFDISRIYSKGSDTDTQFFGTKNYAPPEQYGFSQTDSRTDIYSFGILLRYMVTGKEREDSNVSIYKPFGKIIKKCTAFAPKERFESAKAVKKALFLANPETQRKRKRRVFICSMVLILLCVLGGIKWYQYETMDFHAASAIPAVLAEEERLADAVSYMKDKYGTELFNEMGSYADIGFVKTVLTDVYGYDRDYVYALPEEGPPHESDHNFLPWGMGDEQYVPRDVMIYIAVKIYWVDKVSDYTSIKDDNGYYPGVRVAVAFAEESGIVTGVGRPEDITKGEMAILLANADRVYTALQE